MTILSVCQSLAATIGIAVPTVLFSGTTRTHVELQTLCNEVARDMARRHDWQAFKTIATITGDGSDTDFALPSDYDRMPVKAKLWPSAEPTLPLQQVFDADEWLGLEVQDFDTIVDRWILYGDEIHIKPAVASAATVKYFYQSNLIVAPNAGSNKAAFDADDDTFRLNERTLKLGMNWHWKANKGLPYAEDMESFEAAIAFDIGKDKGPRVLRLGRPRTSLNSDFAFPQALGS